jgi:hypothetical protein
MKILLLHYYAGAGGKFIANCLSYSNKVAFSNYEKALTILTNSDLVFLENCLLDTIPDKVSSHQWLQLEQGCHQLFGRNLWGITKNKSRENITKLNDLTLLGNVWLPLVSHDIDQFITFKSLFSDSEIFTVLVDSTTEFIDLAIRRKWPKEHHCLDLDTYKKFKEECKSANFDFCFNNWNPLIIENHCMITELANKIGCDFDFDLCKNYIEKYVNFHI